MKRRSYFAFGDLGIHLTHLLSKYDFEQEDTMKIYPGMTEMILIVYDTMYSFML